MIIPAFLFSLLAAPRPHSAIPDAHLTIAYRQVSNGKPDQVVLESQLSCFAGECELVTVTVNWCMPGLDGSTIDVGRSSTADGDLKISSSIKGSTAVISAEERAGGATIKYRFECALRRGSTPEYGALKAFSGAAVKDSAVLGKTISWDLLPFKGERVPFHPDCTIILHGLP